MFRLSKFLLISVVLLSLTACVTSRGDKPNYKSEIIRFFSLSRGVEKPVIAMIAIPLELRGPMPVIITQHGSSRDGTKFFGGEGRTDEYSTRLMTEGTKRGFAVAAIDAFYKTNIQPGDKMTFPNAQQYALDLKDILAKDVRFDPTNLFFTGFSYGAAQVNKSVDIRTNFQSIPWRAVAAAEPGCNIVSEPVKVPFPILLIKGSESHYYLEPCQYFERLLRSAGINVELDVIDGANHFFSTGGRITKGVAVNGCRFNPVIRRANGDFQFANGATATRSLVKQKCFTTEGGAGKNRLLLDGVIDRVLDYFEKHRG